MTEGFAKVSVRLNGGLLVIDDSDSLLDAVQISQLSFWGLKRDYSTEERLFAGPDSFELLIKIVAYFHKERIAVAVQEDLETRLHRYEVARELLRIAQVNGQAFKNGTFEPLQFDEFSQALTTTSDRTLKDHQLKAAFHLYSVGNSANFSVPGSGKTAVVLAVFDLLRRRGEVNVLFVVGPPSCFAPWRTEYELTLGKKPTWEIVAGGSKSIRKSRYSATAANLKDLYLTTYQSLMSDQAEIAGFLNQRGVSALFVIDEAHYIKQLDGSWASAVLSLASRATRRVVLTGTPIPRSYEDAFNLFDFLWPEFPPISPHHKITIRVAQDAGDHETARSILDRDISPLFYRVRKSELGLMAPAFTTPEQIEMGPIERKVYDAIENRIRSYAKEDYLKDVDLVRRLQRGRMIRLRQAVSNVALLSTALKGYNENLISERSLAELIAGYESLETPAKIFRLLEILSNLLKGGEKVIIWTNFIGTLKLLQRQLESADISVKVIFGETPIEQTTIRDAETREQILREFKAASGGPQVLILNPAACAESISLHTACRHAIYYDLSYNLAQYLQSLDRIHRVGGSEKVQATYHFLQYSKTIDHDIYANLEAKAARMYALIDQDYAIYSLDMSENDGEGDLAAYKRRFDERRQ